MKKLIRSFGFIAVAAMTIVGCAKEIDAPKEETIEKTQEKVVKTHTVTITAGSPETKTNIVEGESSASFKWSSDDATRFHIFENDVEGTSIGLETGDEYVTVKLTATFETVSAASYTYTAFLAKNVYDGDYPQVPSAQTCTGISYDPNADILIAKPVINEGAVLDKLNMQFGRPCVINKMTLKGLTEGETLSSVEIYADKPLTGYYDIAGKEWTGESAKITLTTSQEVPASGQVTVYFVTIPVEGATLTVTAITDGHVYNKTFGSTINFVMNQVTKFGVSSLGKYVKRDVLTYATAAFNATSGNYKAWSGKSYEGVGYSAAVYAGQSCEINASDKSTYGEYIQLRSTSPSGIITTTSGGAVAKVFVVYGGRSNTDKRSLTVYGKNTAYTATNELYNSATYGEELGTITFNTGDKFGYLNINGYGEYVGLLSGDGAMYFREIQIFWNNNKNPSGLKWTADGNAGVAVAEADASIETGPDNMPAAVLHNPNGISLSAITFASSNTDVATIGEHTGIITLVGEGDTDISAVFAGNETYQSSNIKYTLSVTDNRTEPVITLDTSDVDLTDQNYGSFTGRSATVDQSVTLVYSKTDASSIIDEFNTSTGVLTLSGNIGTATVTVSFVGNAEYKAAVSQSYKITVASSSGPAKRTAPGTPTITAISPTSFTATWTAPSSGGSENGYSWKISPSSNPSDAAITNGSGNVADGVLTVTVSTDITLTTDTDYYFHVMTRGDGGTNYNDSDYATSAAKKYKTYTMTIDSSSNGSNNVHWTASTVSSLSYSNITWSTSVTGTTAVQASTTYAQIGTKNSPATQIQLSTSAFAGKKIISASVTCFCMSNTGPTVSITAGSTTMLNAASLFKNISTTHNTTTNNVTLGNSDTFSYTFNSSAKAAICISQVQVLYCD